MPLRGPSPGLLLGVSVSVTRVPVPEPGNMLAGVPEKTGKGLFPNPMLPLATRVHVSLTWAESLRSPSPAAPPQADDCSDVGSAGTGGRACTPSLPSGLQPQPRWPLLADHGSGQPALGLCHNRQLQKLVIDLLTCLFKDTQDQTGSLESGESCLTPARQPQ